MDWTPPAWLMEGLMTLGVMLAGFVLKYVSGTAKDVREIKGTQALNNQTLTRLTDDFEKHTRDDTRHQEQATAAIHKAETTIAGMSTSLKEVHRRLGRLEPGTDNA